MTTISSVPFMPMLPRLLLHREFLLFPAWAHPQVRYWAPTWIQIRDCLLGDQEIKDKGETYLPKMADMDQKEYERYLDQAVFFNMTARTVNALVGQVFQRDPKITDVPNKLKEDLDKIVYNGISVTSFLTNAIEGIIAMGRYGVLVDRDEKGNTPFLRGYDAENIIDWQMDWVKGRYVPVQIILREFIEINTRTVGEIRKYKIIYRVLSLDFGGQQLITTPSNTNPTLSEASVLGINNGPLQATSLKQKGRKFKTSTTGSVVGMDTGGGPLSSGIPTGPGGTPEGNTYEYGGGSVPIQASPIQGGDDPIYRQYVYTVNNITAPLNTVTPEVFTPTNRGATMDFIPFVFLGAKDNTPDVDRAPAADIAKLNLAHYRTYAHLEHGRFYTALPIYYVQVLPHAEKSEYTLGPSRVWEVAQGEKPGILEFNGQGLKTLENSLTQKEDQISMIGGRLAGNGARSVSESDNQAQIREGNERALLLKAVNNCEEGVESCLHWWCWWQDQPDAHPQVDLNAAFMFDNLGARELRAAHQMYADGVIPVTALHSYLLKAEILPEWMTVEDYKKLLADMDEFPNQPDVWAKEMGYDSAKHLHDVRLARRDLRNKEAQTDLQDKQIEVDQIDVEGNIDVKQQLADTQQQLADQMGDQQDHEQQQDVQDQEHQQKMDLKNHQLSQKQADQQHKENMVAAKAAGKPIVGNMAAPPKPQGIGTRNPNSTPLPQQVSAARNAATQVKK